MVFVDDGLAIQVEMTGPPMSQVEQDRICRTYWGTHGCELERGTHGNDHRCDDGCPTPEGYAAVFGEDAGELARTGDEEKW